MFIHNSLAGNTTGWQHGELGYFGFGVPAIFVDSRCISTNPIQLTEALDRIQSGRNPSHRDFHLVQLFVTNFHELKHFHDSLVNPMLYSLYGINISENYLRWAIIDLMCEDPKLTIDTALKELGGGAEYLTLLNKAKSEYQKVFSAHWTPTPKLINETVYNFSVQTFFELSATIHEVITVIFLAGEDAGTRYWQFKMNESDRLYTHIFEIFTETQPSIHRAIDLALGYFDVAVFSPMNPMTVFMNLLLGEVELERAVGDFGDVLGFCRGAAKYQSELNIEIPLLHDANKMSVADIDALRSQMLRKKLDEWELRSDRQYADLQNSPMPATYFFPSNSDFSNDEGRMYQQEWLLNMYGSHVPLTGSTGISGESLIGAGLMRPIMQLPMFVQNTEPASPPDSFLRKTNDMIFSQWCVENFFGNEVSTVMAVEQNYRDRAKKMGFHKN